MFILFSSLLYVHLPQASHISCLVLFESSQALSCPSLAGGTPGPVVVDDTSARAAATACRRRVQRGRMLTDDGLPDTQDPLLTHNLQQTRALRVGVDQHGAFSAWAPVRSHCMSAGDWWQRGMQPGQPGRCADCSNGRSHGVRTKCARKSWVRYHLFSKTCERYGGADASR